MPTESDFPAIGKIVAADADSVLFQPQNTTYELRLMTSSRYDGPLNERIHCLIRASARKIYTVPSGGNFIAPIAGPPRIIQGRVRHLDEQQLIVQAGAPIIIRLPDDDSAFDLIQGPISFSTLVNVIVFPGATLEWKVPAAAS